MNGHLPPSFALGAHRYSLRVYYEDTDAGGIVYHPSYLRFAERARTEFMRELGVAHARLVDQHHRIFVVRRAKLDYLRPARVDDLLQVTTRLVAAAGVTTTLRQDFERLADGAVLAALEVQLACIGVADGRPARIPQEWRAAMAALLEEAEVEE